MTERINDKLKDKMQAQKKKRSHGRKGNKPSLGMSEGLISPGQISTMQSLK